MPLSTLTLKVFALIADVIYMLFGIAVIGCGVYIIIEFEEFKVVALALIGLGLVVVLCGAFGSFGAVRESNRLLKTFAVVLVVLMVLQLLVVGCFWLFKESLLINVDNHFDKLWRNQTVPIRPTDISHIASLEKWLGCCGNSGPNDYVRPPYSCYHNNSKLNLDGCRQKFLDYVSDRWTALNIIVLVLVLIKLICASLSYILANSILNRWRRSKYYPK